MDYEVEVPDPGNPGETKLATRGAGISLIVDNSHVSILDSTVSSVGLTGIYLSTRSNHVLVDGNTVHGTRKATAILAESRSHDLIVRGNVVYHAAVENPTETGIQIAGTTRAVGENNVVFDSRYGIKATGYVNSGGVEMPCSRVILRNNVAFDNFASPITVNSVGNRNYPELPVATDRVAVYHNSLSSNGSTSTRYGHGSGFYLLQLHSPQAELSEVAIENNIVDSGLGMFVNQYVNNPGAPPLTEVEFSRNHYYHAPFSPPDTYMGDWDGALLEDLIAWKTQLENDASGGTTVLDEPSFADRAAGDFQLTLDSPCIDQAIALTTITTVDDFTLGVENAMYFMDGYGISGETGDEIVIFDPFWDVVGIATVTAVDYDTNVLTVDSVLPDVRVGDLVSYGRDKNGHWRVAGRPDIGAYERTQGAKVEVCHAEQTISIAVVALDAHLEHGDTFGSCR